MTDLGDAFDAAWRLLAGPDPALAGIVGLSLQTSLLAVLLAAIPGLPLGAWLAVHRFRGRGVVVAVANAMMGLPPVVAGLVLYLLLSRSGPLGSLGLLFTPGALVLAQAVLVARAEASSEAGLERLKAVLAGQLAASGIEAPDFSGADAGH